MRGRVTLTTPEQPFTEPCQAQAFAMTLSLHQAGVFTWSEWAEALSHALQDAAPDGSDYYACWVRALEALMDRKLGSSGAQRQALAEAWRRAAQATPHGQPILLENDPQARR